MSGWVSTTDLVRGYVLRSFHQARLQRGRSLAKRWEQSYLARILQHAGTPIRPSMVRVYARRDGA